MSSSATYELKEKIWEIVDNLLDQRLLYMEKPVGKREQSEIEKICEIDSDLKKYSDQLHAIMYTLAKSSLEAQIEHSYIERDDNTRKRIAFCNIGMRYFTHRAHRGKESASKSLKKWEKKLKGETIAWFRKVKPFLLKGTFPDKYRPEGIRYGTRLVTLK